MSRWFSTDNTPDLPIVAVDWAAFKALRDDPDAVFEARAKPSGGPLPVTPSLPDVIRLRGVEYVLATADEGVA